MADDDVASPASEAPEQTDQADQPDQPEQADEPDQLDDADADAADASAAAPARTPANDAELRARMRTLDRTERKWGYVAGGFVLVLSTLLIPSLLHTTYGPPDHKPKPAGHCGHGFRLLSGTCQTVYHPRDFALQFGLLIVLGLVLLGAVWRSKRSLTIFTSMFVGLASAFVGVAIVLLVGLGYGGWLLARSWRLQRYGTTDTKEVRKAATARADAKRAERRAARQGGKAKKDGEAAPARSSVSASKRYTPKSKPRRR